MAARINHQLFFPHTPEAVWEYLTNAELMGLWLMPNDFRPIVNHEFTFRVPPSATLEFDGIVYCKVLEIVPYKTLSYSWKLGPGDGSINIDSVVRWELQPKDKGTNLVLDHADFIVMENSTLLSAMEEGWLKHMNMMADQLNTQKHDTTHA